MLPNNILYILLFLFSCFITSLVLCTIHQDSLKLIIKDTMLLFLYFIGGGLVLAVITYFLTV